MVIPIPQVKSPYDIVFPKLIIFEAKKYIKSINNKNLTKTLLFIINRATNIATITVAINRLMLSPTIYFALVTLETRYPILPVNNKTIYPIDRIIRIKRFLFKLNNPGNTIQLYHL